MKRTIVIQIPVVVGAKIIQLVQPEQLQMLLIISLNVDSWDHEVIKELSAHIAKGMGTMTHATNFGEQCEEIAKLVREKTTLPFTVAINMPMMSNQISLSYGLELGEGETLLSRLEGE